MFNLGVVATVLVIAVLLIISGIKILKEYQRAVIFRLGRLVRARGPGITYVIPFVEKMMRVDLRTVTMDVPAQDVITRDNVSIKVSAVLYFRVIDPNRAITEVQNYLFASSQLAQVTLRSICGQACWTSYSPVLQFYQNHFDSPRLCLGVQDLLNSRINLIPLGE